MPSCISRRPRRTSSMHTNIQKCFRFLSFLFCRWPNSSKQQRKTQQNYFINIKRNFFFPSESIKFQYHLCDGYSNFKRKYVRDIRNQVFIQLCAILLCAVSVTTGTGEITDIMASHRAEKHRERPQVNIIPISSCFVMQKTETRTFI